MTLPSPTITGVILAGGKARRMGGDDKGLISYQQQPLIQHAITALFPQVDELLINANRNLEIYQAYGYPVISDELSDFQGPLAGMLSALQQCSTDYILTVPCDAPKLPPQLRQRLMEALLLNQAEIAVAHDGKRMQPVFCLIPRKLAASLTAYLEAGDRKIDRWLQQHNLVEVDFSDQTDCFANINTPDDLQHAIPTHFPLPVLGFSAFSGTGKTTLLTELIPLLSENGKRVGIIKHAHHSFEIDQPGKDSYRLRQAGATQMLISSRFQLALMQTASDPEQEAELSTLLQRLDHRQLDIVLIEGFKLTAIPKIELHRPSLGHPLLYPDDPNIIAIASDTELSAKPNIPQLPLNDPAAIADFIKEHFNYG